MILTLVYETRLEKVIFQNILLKSVQKYLTYYEECKLEIESILKS